MERMWSSSSFCHIVKFSEWKGPWCRCKNLQKCCGGFLWSTAERSKSWATGAKSCHIKRDTLYGWTCFWNDHFQAKSEILDSGALWKTEAENHRAALRSSEQRYEDQQQKLQQVRRHAAEVVPWMWWLKKTLRSSEVFRKTFQYQVLSWTFTVSLSIFFIFCHKLVSVLMSWS